MRIPLLSATLATPMLIGGASRSRVTAGENPEHNAKKLEFDTKLGLVLIHLKRERQVRSVTGKEQATVGLVLARPEHMEVAGNHASMFDEATTVKPGQR